MTGAEMEYFERVCLEFRYNQVSKKIRTKKSQGMDRVTLDEIKSINTKFRSGKTRPSFARFSNGLPSKVNYLPKTSFMAISNGRRSILSPKR